MKLRRKTGKKKSLTKNWRVIDFATLTSINSNKRFKIYCSPTQSTQLFKKIYNTKYV